MTKDKALKLALEALDTASHGLYKATPHFDTHKMIEEVEASITSIKQALVAPVQEPTIEDNSQDWAGMDGATAWHLIDRHADGWADVAKMMGEWLAANTQPAAPVQNSDHEFKNFHRVLCERFGYTHDEIDWKRDQVSLIEWIAKQVNPAAPVQEPVAVILSQWKSGAIGATEAILELFKHYPSNPSISATQQTAQQAVPEGYALIGIDALKAWGKYDLVKSMCMFPVDPPAAQRQWVHATPWRGLTDEDIQEVRENCGITHHAIKTIEAKLREKNT